MLAIEPWAWDCCDEELGAVCVWTSVSHGKKTWSCVLGLEVLISELSAVDGFTTAAVAECEVTTLDHELWDDTVESAALVVEWLARLACALFTCAKAAEVLGCLWNNVGVEFENNTAGWLVVDSNIEEDTWA